MQITIILTKKNKNLDIRIKIINEWMLNGAKLMKELF